VISEDDHEPLDVVDHAVSIPRTIDMLTPILASVPLQLLAYLWLQGYGHQRPAVQAPRPLSRSAESASPASRNGIRAAWIHATGAGSNPAAGRSAHWLPQWWARNFAPSKDQDSLTNRPDVVSLTVPSVSIVSLELSRILL
jgi:hypothetical protein